MKLSHIALIGSFLLFFAVLTIHSQDKRAPPGFVNSLGMEMVRIESGTFRMGNNGEIDYSRLIGDEKHTPYLAKGSKNPYIGDGPQMAANPLEWDEAPVHEVTISRAFYMAATPVTNAQYEQFRPGHRSLRGKSGFSRGDNEAVVYISWEDAVAFTEWLSAKEGEPYRLPTEAEWEYAARAGTTTAYSTGDSLPRIYWQHQVMNRSHSIQPDSVNLTVKLAPPNNWGLYNMHGLVEEWCSDWYGPYSSRQRMDPAGAKDGIARVTRGGSHSTGLPFLRSANRAAALPQTCSFLIGFRVVKGEKNSLASPNPVQDKPLWAIGVSLENGWGKPVEINDKPFFSPPKTFARVSPESNGPLYFIHNHEPALTALPNGDLLAIWFSTVTERGREMVLAGARLRKGAKEWDRPDVFFHVPDRNLTGQALWWDGEETVYHFSGVGVGDDWKRLSLIMRKSRDNGNTWSKPVIIRAEFEERHQPVDAVMKTSGGELVLLCDASWDGSGGTAVHVSTDNGLTWNDPGFGKPQPVFKEGKTGAWIAGIHAGIVELKDGRWLALGRGDEINEHMPMSISSDKGKSWVYSASPFPPVKSAQRLAMMRLKEGAILLVSFEPGDAEPATGSQDLKGRGMFAALSFDEGETWPVKKLITAESGMRKLTAPCNYRWGHPYDFLDSQQGEARGYLTVQQAPDGIIHVLSSGTHYSFNLKWITE